MMEEPDFIKEAPILKFHKARRVVTRNGFHCLRLFSIATDEQAFFDQWYKSEDGTEPCGHFDFDFGGK